MSARKVYDREGHAQFVTFSCYHRRAHLQHDRAKKIVLGTLCTQLSAADVICSGFAVMPDHVHVILTSQRVAWLGPFMKVWKQQSSLLIKSLFEKHLTQYASSFDLSDPIWQTRYYPFNLLDERKALEKLTYIHLNPVRRGYVKQICDWPFSSARYFELGKPVGVPLKWPFG
jgi:putative transposase